MWISDGLINLISRIVSPCGTCESIAVNSEIALLAIRPLADGASLLFVFSARADKAINEKVIRMSLFMYSHLPNVTVQRTTHLVRRTLDPIVRPFHIHCFAWQAQTQVQTVYRARESPVPNSNTSSEDEMPDMPVDTMALYDGPSSPLIT